MSIYDDLLAAMAPGLEVEAVAIGPHLTAVKSGLGAGLAATFRSERRGHAAAEVWNAGELAGGPLDGLARMIFSDKPMERGVGMAAINAGLRVEGLKLKEDNGADRLAAKARGASVVMVGHFSFADQIKAVAREFAVLELEPREGDLPAAAAGRVLPRAEVVAITGSAFANHTIAGLLERTRGKWTLVMGPTTPFAPFLLDRGIDVLAGSVVVDADLTMRQVGQGAIFKQLTGIGRMALEK